VTALGQVVILNGTPRSGKSGIVKVVQDTFEGVWMNLGVDAWVHQVTPRKYAPGIGLRPSHVDPDHPALPLVPAMYVALYDAIAAQSRHGLNVIADFGHYDLTVLTDCARRLDGLPVLFVGVRCPIEEIMARRNAGAAAGNTHYAAGTKDDPVPEPVRRWQDAVHAHWEYDMEVDTSLMSPQDCARAIAKRLAKGPQGTALARIAGHV
jgi:chloramphenicol 3-O phosphotransferase